MICCNIFVVASIFSIPGLRLAAEMDELLRAHVHPGLQQQSAAVSDKPKARAPVWSQDGLLQPSFMANFNGNSFQTFDELFHGALFHGAFIIGQLVSHCAYVLCWVYVYVYVLCWFTYRLPTKMALYNEMYFFACVFFRFTIVISLNFYLFVQRLDLTLSLKD